MKKITASFMVILLIVLPIFCYGESEDTFIRKDPILAAALSWYIPGLGQIYGGDILKGAIFWIAEEALLVTTIMIFAELKLDVTGNIGIGINIEEKESPGAEQQKIAVVLGIALITVHLINVIDAVNTTRNYNRKYEEDLFTNFEYDEETKAYTLGVQGKF